MPSGNPVAVQVSRALMHSQNNCPLVSSLSWQASHVASSQNSTVTEIDLGSEYIATKIIKVFCGFNGIHSSKIKNLVIWHHKKLFFLFYLLTLQNIQ